MEKIIEVKYIFDNGKLSTFTHVSGELRKSLSPDGELVLAETLQGNKERIVGILSVLLGVERAK